MRKFKVFFIISMVLFAVFTIELIPTLILKSDIKDDYIRTNTDEYMTFTGEVERLYINEDDIEIYLEKLDQSSELIFETSYYMKEEVHSSGLENNIDLGKTVKVQFFPSSNSYYQDYYEIASLEMDGIIYLSLDDYIDLQVENYNQTVKCQTVHTIICISSLVVAIGLLVAFFVINGKIGDKYVVRYRYLKTTNIFTLVISILATIVLFYSFMPWGPDTTMPESYFTKTYRLETIERNRSDVVFTVSYIESGYIRTEKCIMDSYSYQYLLDNDFLLEVESGDVILISTDIENLYRYHTIYELSTNGKTYLDIQDYEDALHIEADNIARNVMIVSIVSGTILVLSLAIYIPTIFSVRKLKPKKRKRKYNLNNEWKTVETEKDIEELQTLFGGFNDACLKELKYVSGSYVSNNLSMHPEDDIRQVSIIIQKQNKEHSAVELVFNYVETLNLQPSKEGYDSIISGLTISLKDNFIYFADNIIDIENTNDDLSNYTWLKAKSLRWREVNRYIGQQLVYVNRKADNYRRPL